MKTRRSLPDDPPTAKKRQSIAATRESRTKRQTKGPMEPHLAADPATSKGQLNPGTSYAFPAGPADPAAPGQDSQTIPHELSPLGPKSSIALGTGSSKDRLNPGTTYAFPISQAAPAAPGDDIWTIPRGPIPSEPAPYLLHPVHFHTTRCLEHQMVGLPCHGFGYNPAPPVSNAPAWGAAMGDNTAWASGLPDVWPLGHHGSVTGAAQRLPISYCYPPAHALSPPAPVLKEDVFLGAETASADTVDAFSGSAAAEATGWKDERWVMPPYKGVYPLDDDILDTPCDEDMDDDGGEEEEE